MSVPADLNDSVAAIIRTEGVKVLTLKLLRRRLETQYKMDFEPHQTAIDNALAWAMSLPDIQRELAKAKAEKEAGPIGGKGKKRQAAKKESVKEVKQKKPEGYPKAACGSYLMFVNDHRDTIKNANPNLKSTEIVKAISDMWNKASDSEKEKYKELAEKDKERFKKEMEEYQANGGTAVQRRGKAKVVKEGPKRAKNPFMFFSSEYRAKNPGPIIEVSKAAGAAWEKMSPAERKPFEDMSAQDKERYQRELEAQQ